MKNQSVSDFVAATMNAVLNSAEHKSLFASQYKYAETHCAKHNLMDSCAADDQDAKKKDSYSADDDNDAKKKDSSKADDDNDAKKKDSSKADDDNDAKKKDSSKADDDNDAKKGKMPPWLKDKSDSFSSDDLEPSVAFDVAIDSLLTASAALDTVGLGRGSALTLKIASLVVEAKKKDKASKKSPASKSNSKGSSKSDPQSSKDKASKEKASKEKAAKEKAKSDKEKSDKAKSKAKSSSSK